MSLIIHEYSHIHQTCYLMSYNFYFFLFDFLLWPLLAVSSWSIGVCVLSCFSHVRLFATLWTVACQAPLSMEFSKHKYWSRLPRPPPPGDPPDPGLKLTSFRTSALAGKFFITSATGVWVYLRFTMPIMSSTWAWPTSPLQFKLFIAWILTRSRTTLFRAIWVIQTRPILFRTRTLTQARSTLTPSRTLTWIPRVCILKKSLVPRVCLP